MRANRRVVLSVAGLSALAMAAPTSAAEDNAANKATAERFVNEVLNGRNFGVMDEIVSPEYESQNPDDAPGRDAYKTRLSQKLEFDGYMVENMTHSIEDMAVRSPNVFVRGYVTGTSTGGKKVNAVYFIQFRFRDGMIVTDWMLRDEIAMMGL